MGSLVINVRDLPTWAWLGGLRPQEEHAPATQRRVRGRGTERGMESFRTSLQRLRPKLVGRLSRREAEKDAGRKGYGAFKLDSLRAVVKEVLMRRKAIAGVVAVAAMAISAPAAFAVGGPNSPGQSGKFKPNSEPCQGPTTSRTVPARRTHRERRTPARAPTPARPSRSAHKRGPCSRWDGRERGAFGRPVSCRDVTTRLLRAVAVEVDADDQHPTSPSRPTPARCR